MSKKQPILNLVLMDNRWTSLTSMGEDEVSHVLENAAHELGQDFSAFEMSVVLSNDQQLHALNKSYRQKDKPTNVLSFHSDIEEELGDVLLAYETVMKEARDANIPPRDHTIHLIIHGFLHLLGYDHENEQDAHEMETMETRILKTLDIANPYEVI
jgi:probable rRNA maturation factor